MNVSKLIEVLNNELSKRAYAASADTCQHIVMNDEKLYIKDQIIIYGNFQEIPKHTGGRFYPITERPHPNPNIEHFLRTKGV